MNVEGILIAAAVVILAITVLGLGLLWWFDKKNNPTRPPPLPAADIDSEAHDRQQEIAEKFEPKPEPRNLKAEIIEALARDKK